MNLTQIRVVQNLSGDKFNTQHDRTHGEIANATVRLLLYDKVQNDESYSDPCRTKS
jgi:hypothetical protein